MATIVGGERLPVPLGLEFADNSVDESREENAHNDDYMEDLLAAISDTFDDNFERSREDFPPYIKQIAYLTPPQISNSLLNYRNSLPVSVRIYYSSFGSNIILQRGRLRGRQSDDSALFAKLTNRCPYDFAAKSLLMQRVSHYQSYRNSWNSSAILRSIRQGALVRSEWSWTKNFLPCQSAVVAQGKLRSRIIYFLQNMFNEACQHRRRKQESGSSVTLDCSRESEAARALLPDVRIESDTFACGDGKHCTVYQAVEQCGALNLYLPKFCVF